ncbi:MAG: MoxR family ATPase [Clostridium sp.]|nr:MoxR family ATPase [Clostridium sp.]
MNLPITVNQNELLDILLNVAPVRPVFIWGAPGIGKSALVNAFAESVGLECVSLLGSQLAPEDIIGIPQIKGDYSVFVPPKIIARKEPYCLFLDELNACSQEVQKAFYSLIHEKRVGEYYLPEGSIIIGAGNRAQDSAIVKPMSSALINRMFHVELKVSTKQWLSWASENNIHPYIIEYITLRPDHLFSPPPKTEEAFSTPRSWHMLSDAMNEYKNDLKEETLKILAYGTLSPNHAGQFIAFIKQVKNRYKLSSIISGEEPWPNKPEDRDVLYFLAQSFRAQIIKELPLDKKKLNENSQYFAHRAKALIKDLSLISLEIAQMVVGNIDENSLPNWFMIEIVRDLPRLVEKKNG